MTSLRLFGGALAALVLVSSACGGPTPAPRSSPPTATRSTSAAPSAAPVRARQLVLTAPESAVQGNLIVGWFRAEELAQVRAPAHPRVEIFPALLPRFVLRPGVALARGATLTLPLDVPPEATRVFALVAAPHRFWEGLLGAPGSNSFIGAAPVSPDARDVSIALEAMPASKEPPPERCQGERYRLLRIAAPEVAGRVQNDTSRRLCVYLPPSYGAEPRRRYPVAYLFPGLMSTDTAYVRGPGSLAEAADDLARQTKRELILVGVDTSTRSGSTYLTDSEWAGRWERFVVDRVLKEVDGSLRTLPRAEARALIGQSTGGFNAVSYGLRYPEAFSVIAASAPDGLDLEDWLFESGRARPLWRSWTRLEDAVGRPGQLVSYADAWSTGESGALVWPFDLESGAIDEARFAVWRAHSPLVLLSERADAVKKRYSKRLFIAVATDDEFDLFRPAQRFSQRLRELGIEHEFVAGDGGHFAGASARLRQGLGYAVERLATR